MRLMTNLLPANQRQVLASAAAHSCSRLPYYRLLFRNRLGWFDGSFRASRFDNFLDDFQGNLLEMRFLLEHLRAP